MHFIFHDDKQSLLFGNNLLFRHVELSHIIHYANLVPWIVYLVSNC